MITIVCTTNRPDSNSRKIAQLYHDTLTGQGEDSQILDLKDLDAQWIQQSMYGANHPKFDAVLRTFIRPVEKLVLIVPEYNGSFPGYLKFFMDACDHGEWQGKKVALMGLASGRSGNVRGVDHLTGILHYLGSEVFSKKVYLSQINHLLNAEGLIDDELLIKEVRGQMKGFVSF